MYSVIYSELCFQAGGQRNAEASIEKWMEESRMLRQTAEAHARAKVRGDVPMGPTIDEVTWADADRRALRNLSDAPSSG